MGFTDWYKEEILSEDQEYIDNFYKSFGPQEDT